MNWRLADIAFPSGKTVRPMFNSLAAAAHGLLLSVSRSLTVQKGDFIVVGGWVPVIRGGAKALRHPARATLASS